MKVMSEKFIKMENFKKQTLKKFGEWKNSICQMKDIVKSKENKINQPEEKKYLNMNIVHVHIVKYLIPTEREIKNEKSIQKSMGHL